MIGQYIEGKVDIQLDPLDTTLQSQITEMRNDTIKKIRQRFQFQFLTGNIYLRPIIDVKHSDIDTMQLMKEYGICHAFWTINAGPVDYILDFIREGIRFEMVQNANQTIMEHKDIYIPVFKAPVSLNINSTVLMDWIESQANIYNQYDVNTNHCLHFVDRFGQEFKPEIFHEEFKESAKISKFNTGIEQKTNEELLAWTKSIIDSNA